MLRGGLRGVGSSESLAAVSDYRLAGGRVLGRGLGEGLRPADVFVSKVCLCVLSRSRVLGRERFF